VYHRGYDTREPIEIRVEIAEMVVLSYPGPDRSVRLEQLQKGKANARRYRNRRIGEFLKELKFTEGRSTGISKILGAMRENGSPAPEFEFDEDHSYFLVRLPVHPAALEVVQQKPRPESRLESGADSRLESQLESQLESLGQKVLKLLAESAASKAELSEKLGQKRVSGQLHKVMRDLIAEGRVNYTLPDKPNSRLQKYRLP
jgi:ATP-dependent DNA helicase RecG